MKQNRYWRWAALGLGVVISGLGCYGAFELGVQLEGTLNYLAIASPVIAGASALVPPMAENLWRSGQKFKSVCWWLALIPAASVVFSSAAERIHSAKSGAAAERAAFHESVARAEEDLKTAKAEAQAATAKADKVRGLDEKACGPKCRNLKASETTALGRVTDAEKKLLETRKLSKAGASLTAPVWLLPLSLDLIAFLSIWSALSTPKPVQKVVAKKKRKAVAKKNPTPPKKKAVVAQEGNVVRLQAR